MDSDKKNIGPQLSFFLPNLHGGGAEKVLPTLASELAQRGISVDFVLVNAVGINLQNLSGQVRVVDLKASNTFLSLPRLIRYFKQQHPLVFISSLDLTNLIALISRKLSGVNLRLFIRIENTISSQRRVLWKKRLEKLLLSYFYPQADGLISVSKSVANDISLYAGVSPAKIYTIYNPVVTQSMLKKSLEVPSHKWFKEDAATPVVLGVGRLNVQKDFQTLIKAFGLLRQHMDVKLLILGEGEERHELENLIKSLGLEEDVDLYGYVENPYPYMRHADVFALSSAWEGLPTVLIEALACGASVVSTNCPGGIHEILADGLYGEIVPVGDSGLLADAIEKTILTGGKKADVDWLKQFSLDQVVGETVRILDLQDKVIR